MFIVDIYFYSRETSFKQKKMDEIDRVAARVSLAALSGLVGGAALATYKGSPLPKTSVSMAVSCALVGTACFGFERLSNVALQQVVVPMDDKNNDDTEKRLFYGSHALGGMIGGGIAGALFQHRPIPGMLLCTPIMIGVAFAEEKFQEERQLRLQQHLLINKSEGATQSVSDDEGSMS